MCVDHQHKHKHEHCHLMLFLNLELDSDYITLQHGALWVMTMMQLNWSMPKAVFYHSHPHMKIIIQLLINIVIHFL